MNKRISHLLRVFGCIVLSFAILLSACGKTEETKKKKKKTKKTTTEITETTDEPSESSDPTETDPTETDPTSAPTQTETTRQKKQPIYFQEEAGKKLHELDEEIFKRGMEEDIISIVFDIEDPSKLGLEWPEKGIEPYSPEDEEEGHEFDLHVLEALDEIDFDSLSVEDQILYETMMRDYELSVSLYGMDYYTSVFNSLTGINVELPIVFATLNFDDQADAERYLQMIDDIDEYYDSLFAYEKKRAELGRSYPDEFLDQIIASLDAVYKDHDGNYMYTTFENRVNELKIDDKTKADLIKRNKEVLDNSFFPAYEKLSKNMQTLKGTAKTSGKICEMEGGKEFYEKYFQYRSGTDLTIDEAKQVLEDMMNQYLMEFGTLYQGLTPQQQASIGGGDSNYTTGSFEKDIEFCKKAIKDDFPDIGDVKYTVYHLPQEMADFFSPAAYMSTPIDDINRNVLLINDYSDGLSDMLTTVGHEAFPGHLYEAVYHMIHMNNYYQKGGTTAYKEGWSTYCEDYIMKLSDYEYNPYRANYVYTYLFFNYAVNAYVDILVHYDGCGKDEIAAVFDDILGPGSGKMVADVFYDRVIEIPCYVTPYCFGNYYCCKIINDAAAKYGNEYSMKQIHAAYLDMGPSTFELLQKYMPVYLEKQK